MADEIEGIEELFRMPRQQSREESWLAAARAFHADSAPYEEQFEEYGLQDKFRDDLQALITAVEAAMNSIDVSQEQRGGATGGLRAAIREAGRLSRKLKGIVENKYFDSAEKLAAWLIASHTQAAPKRTGESEPVPA